jgi:methylated-DNA-protein-cysteine methyltransferase-like protein
MKTFSQKVVLLALSIPKGRVTTYGRIARAAGGGSMASQSVTAVLGKAYDAGEKQIPFHRIVYANGRIWVSPKYRKDRMRMYKAEGIKVDKQDKIVDFGKLLFEFK